MINPQEWLRTRKNLLDEVKAQVGARLGEASLELRRYAEGLAGEFSGAWRPCPARDLRRAVNGAAVVLGADFHAYFQSQKAHVRVLRDHVERDSVTLALECLAAEHEAAAADFLAGRISEKRFLSLIDWEGAWGFPWEHYRPLFELARDRGFRVRGLGRPRLADLKARDAWTAKRILELLRAEPGTLVYVVIGEWHVGRPHLPRRLARALPGAGRVVKLFQDVEPLYFRLARARREGKVECLKGSHDRYCLMVSPPWMKWQSYLMYLEHAYDRDLEDEVDVDYSDHVAALVKLLAADLKTAVPTARVQVYGPASGDALSRGRRRLSRKLARALVYHLEHGLSFFLPECARLYLSRPTINHASSLAGQFVHAHLAQRTRTLWDLPRDFLPLIWVEALGFFFSKWINPKRKPESLEAIRARLAVGRPRDRGREALLLALDHRLSEVLWVRTRRLRRPRYRPRDLAAHLEAARILGSMLGERLFQKVRSRTISLAQLMSYLKVSVENREFAPFYWGVIRKLEHDREL